MRPDHLNDQRLNDLEKILTVLYKKLAVFEEESALNSSPTQKFELIFRIKQTRIDILKKEAEYEELIAEGVQEVVLVVSDVEANNAIVRVKQGIKHIENIPSERYSDPEELKRLLEEIHKRLNQGKTAQAKLKIALPIIPLLASYELEMDTEAFLVEVWSAIKSMVRRRA